MRECGRSMVEMLGVLAIIGVLSVGAIAGYSKAMMKYRLNKQAEQIGSILDYISVYTDELNRDRNNMSYHMLPLLIKLGVIPQEMIHENSSPYIYDSFDNQILLFFGRELTGNYFGASVFFSNYDKHICRNLFNIAKYRSNFITYAFIQKATEDSSAIQSTWFKGDSMCVSQNNCLKNITIKQIDDTCTMCEDALSGTCRVMYLFNTQKTD